MSHLQFIFVPIGIVAFLIGMILFIFAGGMGLMRMFRRKRVGN